MIWVPLYAIYFTIHGVLFNSTGTMSERLMTTLNKGIEPNFGGRTTMPSNIKKCSDDDPGENQVMLTSIEINVVQVGIENESSKPGMNKSPSAVPFINAEEISNST